MTKREMEDRILAAAAGLFREKGYAAATTREIAGAAGILLGSLTYRYPSKHEILAAVAERGMARSLAICREAIAATTEPLAALRQLFRAHLRILTSADDAIFVVLYEWRALKGDARKRIVGQRDEYEAVWGRLLDEAARTGTIAPDVDLRMLRILFMSAANWSPQWFDPGSHHSADEVADEFFDLICSGSMSLKSP